MAFVVCDRVDCKYRTETRSCSKEFVMLNQIGICNEYFDDNGNPRMRTLSSMEEEAENFIKNSNKTIDN